MIEHKAVDEALTLTRRLRASGVRHLVADRLLGWSALGPVYMGLDSRVDQPVLIRLVDSDLAYDIGSEEFLRGVADTEEVLGTVVLDPSPETGQGAVCSLSPFRQPERLVDRLGQLSPPSIEEVTSVVRETARALAQAHRHGPTRSEVRLDDLYVVGGRIVLTTPPGESHGLPGGSDAVRSLATVAIDLYSRIPWASPEVWAMRRARLEPIAAGEEAPSLEGFVRLIEDLGSGTGGGHRSRSSIVSRIMTKIRGRHGAE
ncbi:MAG TPA: hypothetical protein VMG41_01365 [Gemmatimonadales bacterium]|nr:hypothetical protein [Gemmatimonadales bacterium]